MPCSGYGHIQDTAIADHIPEELPWKSIDYEDRRAANARHHDESINAVMMPNSSPPA
jgi:hypothetical protein